MDQKPNRENLPWSTNTLWSPTQAGPAHPDFLDKVSSVEAMGTYFTTVSRWNRLGAAHAIRPQSWNEDRKPRAPSTAQPSASNSDSQSRRAPVRSSTTYHELPADWHRQSTVEIAVGDREAVRAGENDVYSLRAARPSEPLPSPSSERHVHFRPVANVHVKGTTEEEEREMKAIKQNLRQAKSLLEERGKKRANSGVEVWEFKVE